VAKAAGNNYSLYLHLLRQPSTLPTERDEEDENTEHSDEMWRSYSAISSGGTVRKSLITHADGF